MSKEKKVLYTIDDLKAIIKNFKDSEDKKTRELAVNARTTEEIVTAHITWATMNKTADSIIWALEASEGNE